MYFNEINILDLYSAEWKSACVGVYQLLSKQYLCVLYDFHNNQRLFRQTAWSGWY